MALTALFVAGQIAALSHELEHVLYLHDGPCALHVAAEHLAMASPPDPTAAVTGAPVTGITPQPLAVAPERRARPAGARAPPARLA